MTALASENLRARTLVMFASDPADCARASAHDDALGRHRAILQPLYAFEKRTVGHAGGRKDAIALCKFLKIVNMIQILDAPFAGAALFVIVAEDQASLELAADAAKRCCGQYAFGSAA